MNREKKDVRGRRTKLNKSRQKQGQQQIKKKKKIVQQCSLASWINFCNSQDFFLYCKEKNKSGRNPFFKRCSQKKALMLPEENFM